MSPALDWTHGPPVPGPTRRVPTGVSADPPTPQPPQGALSLGRVARRLKHVTLAGPVAGDRMAGAPARSPSRGL